jgi:hypothetical protein
LTGKTKSTEPTPSEPEASEQDGKRLLIRHPLTSLSGLIAEPARVYRAMRDNKIEHGKGRSLVWVLSQMRAMIETQALERLEQRLEELAPSIEGKARGFTSTDRPSRTAARTAHAGRYPEDDVETMMVIGWQPLTGAEWIAKYGVSTVEE